MRTFPTPKLAAMQLAIVAVDNSTSSRTTFDMVAYILSQFPSLSDSGVSGYAFYSGFGSNQSIPMSRGFIMSAVLPDSSTEDMRRLWEPVLAHVNATWPGFLQIIQTPTFSSFYAWFQENYDQSEAGTNGYGGSRLLDANHLTRDLNKSAEALERFGGSAGAGIFLVAGKGVHNAQPRGGGNAVVPAWRKAYAFASK